MPRFYCLALLFALPAAAQDPEIRLVRIATGLTNPIDVQAPRDGSKRLFFVQQNGVIRVMRDGALKPAAFLNITSKTRSNGECGLLGLAFPPGFAEKRHFYVNYTDTACRNSFVARYRITGSDPDVADAGTEEVILQQAQPFANHNGGGLAFGPDGYLYIGFGDGGSGGDPQNNGQSPGTWLGKMLRIDVESGERPYRVPADNPLVSDSRFKPEIWAYGLRNPWRYSFDRETRDLWIGDVGQNRAEEIDFQPGTSRGGENYGWRTMEGLACFNPSTNCNQDNLVKPVHEYTRVNGDVSVTGGYVYRGSRWAGLRGTYIYGDFASGRIWGIRREGQTFNNRLLLRAQGVAISTFGEDEDGEVYVGDHNGSVFRIEGSSAPQLTNRSVVNGASFEVGLTPGSAATAFVSAISDTQQVIAATSIPLPRELAGVKVLVNGSEAPIYAVANSGGQEQVNFQAPLDLTGRTARVAVTFRGVTSAEVEVPVIEYQPAIFVSGALAIAVRSSDNTLMTAARPLRRGDFAYFYATGLGPVSNAPATGAAAPREPAAITRAAASVTIGGENAEVPFAGLAPGFVGVYQVNIRVPQTARTGEQDMVIAAGGVRSRAVRVIIE